ncbi:MAG: trigger factor, partial [Oscillospiraceae bacterium]|nr:trigger factor [Oscillospiraceae bacterium]
NALIEQELDNQMNDFAYRLQMSGMSVEQYAKMMGGDLNTMRQAFKPVAEKQALSNLVITKVAEVEGITVSDEELEAEFAEMAKAYELEIEKIKEMVPTEEIKSNLQSRKTVKFLVDNAVAKAE